ncbi:MAG: type IV toxin-antitoxin system AbiEi family antitoxin domain-containing protein, partial [Spirochaetia bacterium]
MITGPEFELFEKNHGYAPLQALKNASVHTSRITKLLDSGAIVKIAPGYYRLANIPLHPHQSMIDICMFMNQAVVCLHSALSYYELTTASPISVMIALPRSSKPK